MSLLQPGRRRLNAQQPELYREAQGSRALAKRRIPTFTTQPLARTATIGRLRTVNAPLTGYEVEETPWADAQGGPGKVRARIEL